MRSCRTCAAAFMIAVPLILHGVAAGGVTLIGVGAVSAVTSLMRLESDVELFRGDLLERRLDALAELGFAGEDGDRAVGVDADPGIQIGRLLKAARKRRRRRRCHCRRRSIALRERRPADEKLTTSAPPPASTCAARDDGPFIALIRCLPRFGGIHQRLRRDARRAGSAYACRSGTRFGSSSGADFRIGRLRISLQQRLRAHHHAGDAVAALRRLLLHEGALDRRRRLEGAEAFQRRDLLALKQ